MRRACAGRCRLILLPLLMLALAAQAAALQFPPLTGRVVDAAKLLSPDAVRRLDATLAEHERKTAEQVVVATVPSLQGTDIADYGYQLGRHWGIGRAGKDNGLLLIVAPRERQVRIEVGYGLEGTMTDAKSRNIIEAIILPWFRQGNMEQGILAGTAAILSLLEGRSVTVDGKPAAPPRRNTRTTVPFWPILLVMIFIAARLGAGPIFASPWPGGRRGRWRRGPSGWPGGFGGGGGGGFRGGGGSFGGGGASGRW